MFDLDNGNGCGNRKYHRVRNGFLVGEVYDLRVRYDFVKIGNGSRKLVSVCELEGVVKMRKDKCCCSCFSFEDNNKK